MVRMVLAKIDLKRKLTQLAQKKLRNLLRSHFLHKMKIFAGIAAIAATASTVSAFDPEFLRGAQTGMFLTSEEQFQDYECETPKPDAKIQ